MRLNIKEINKEGNYIEVGALELGFKTTLAQFLLGLLIGVIFGTVGFILGLVMV